MLGPRSTNPWMHDQLLALCRLAWFVIEAGDELDR
jgi:hypothetical protein